MAKTQTIDVNTLTKDLHIPANTKSTVLNLVDFTGNYHLSGTNDGNNDTALNVASAGNDLTISFDGSEHKIILDNYFAKNGKFPVKTIKIGDESFDLISYVNEHYLRGFAQNKDGGVAKSISGTVFDDKLGEGSRNQTINAGAGNDIIFASSPNSTLIGGVGTNTMKFDYDDYDDTSFGDDTIKLTKGETLNLNITKNGSANSIELSYSRGTSKCANDLIITNDANPNDSITLQNYYGKDTGATVLINGKDLSKETIDLLVFDDSSITNTVLTGSALADVIDASDADKQYKTVKKNGKKVQVETALTINAGAGDDMVIGSEYNDVITGGAGNNRIIINPDNYDSGEFGNDIVKLTNGENLVLDLTAYYDGGKTAEQNISAIKQKLSVSGNDLLLKFSDDSSVKLASFAKGANADVKLLLKEASAPDANDAVSIDLNSDKYLSSVNNLVTKVTKKAKTATFTGTRLSEELTVNEALNDYTKTINMGDGENTVNLSGLGTTTIVSGVDDDTINIDGTANSSLTKTTIKAGKGTNTININVADNFGTVTLAEEKVGATNIINFNEGLGGEYQLQKDGNDLVIVRGAVETSSLRIVGYYATDAVKTKNKYANIQFQLNGVDKEYADLLTAIGGHTTIRGKGTIAGTADSDEIIADDHTNLKLKASNDVIKAGKGDDRINAGKGKNTIYYYDGDGNDIIEVGEGTDTLVFANAKSFNDLSFEYGDSSNMDFNLYIRYGDNTITLEMFQKWGTSVQYIKVGNKTRAISSFAPKMDGTDGNDTFISTVFNDTIEGKGGTNTVIYQGGSFGNDVINLTGGENLVLDFTAYEDLWGSGAITRSVVGDDLVVTMKGWDDNGKRVTHGTVTLKGFGKENVVGEDGSVILKLPDDEQMDLNTAEWDVNVTSNYTGNRFNEYIDAYSAKKAITITGGKGDDYIESSHYKATTFVFNEGDGNDIITNTKVNDSIKMNYTGEINYVNNGNDLIIEYGDGDTLQVNDYFVTDKKERIDKIQIKTAKGYETKSLAELTHIDDVEKTTLNVRINDGEIVLNPDTQYTTINFVGMNTLTHLEVLDYLWEGKNTDDLYIAYGNSGDVIILKDYVKTKGVHNLKQFKVDGGVYDLPQRYYSGDNNSIESSPMKEHIYLDGGNHTINFGMTDHFGNRYDYVYSQKEQNTDTDTMKLTDYSFEDGELSAYRTATVSLGGQTAYGSIVLNAHNSEGRSNYVQYVDAFSGKTPNLQIQDKNGIIRVDQLAAAGSLNWNTTEEAGKNHIAFLYGTEGNDVKNNVVSNEKRNYINTYDNAALNYTYNGGHDVIRANGTYEGEQWWDEDDQCWRTPTYGTDDIYNINSFTANSKLTVLDNGGLNDTVNINVAGMTSDDFYLLCDIGCDYDSAPSPDAWATALVHKDALTLDTLRAYFDYDTYNAANDTQQNNAIAGVLKFNGATNSVYDEFLDNWDSYTAIEHLKVNGSEDIDIAAWKKYIGGKVHNWLENTIGNDSHLLFYYHSPSAVLRAISEGRLELTEEQLNGLLDCFKVKYSEVPKTTIFSSENSDVTTGDDTYNLGYAHNKITFDNQTIGKDTIVSPEKEYNASFRDKIVFAEESGYSIANGTLDVQKDGDDLVIGKKGDLANNSITYKNFMTDLTHNDTYIVDSTGDRYDLYVPTRGMGGVEDNSNNIVYAQIGEYGTQSISTSKSGRNFVYSYGEYNPEEYTYDKNLGMYQCVYRGAQDTVISYSDKANDNYEIWGFDSKSMLNVTDNGGANDTLEWGYRSVGYYYTEEMFDEARLVFDVDADGIVFDDFMFVHEDKLDSTTLYNTTQQDLVAGVLRYNATKSDTNSFGIEKVTLQNTDYTYSEINMNKWAYAIAKNVKAWLNDGTMNTAGYTSAYEAFANASHIDISGLVACYNVDYATVDSASTVLNITQGMEDFSISNYDGYETLNYSAGGVMDPNHLHYTKDGDDLIITVTDAYPTITLTDYYKGGHCVKQVDVANGNITYIPIRIGTNGDDTFETQYLQEEIYLKGGNDTVAFNGTNFYGVDQIFTEGTADNLTTMTFDSYSLNEDGLSFYAMFNDDYNRLDIHTSKQFVASYEYYFSDDKPTLQVWDKSHEGYFIDKNKTVVDADWTEDTQQWYNHVSFLMANGDNKIISNEHTNLITASNGAKLDYTYNGGQDKVFAGSHADDSYTINSFDADTKLVIHDNGGDNNTLNFADANKGDIRLFFNVGQEKDHINEQTMEWEYRDVVSNEYAFVYSGQNGVFNAETLGNFVADPGNTNWIDGVLTFRMECYLDDQMNPDYGQFSTVSTKNGDIDFYAWKDQVTASVQSWLTSGANTQGYKTAFEAFENAADDGADITGLVAAYNVNYTQG